MAPEKKQTRLWLSAGLMLSLLALLVVFRGLSGTVAVTDPEELPKAADAVLSSIHTGDWATLSQLVSGSPMLSPETGAADSAEAVIWAAYCGGLQWTCADDFTVQGPCVALRVTVNCLDIPGVTAAMAESMKSAAPTGSETQTQILKLAAEQILDSNAPRKEQEITLNFLREKGQWKLVPDRALQALLSGFTTF